MLHERRPLGRGAVSEKCEFIGSKRRTTRPHRSVLDEDDCTFISRLFFGELAQAGLSVGLVTEDRRTTGPKAGNPADLIGAVVKAMRITIGDEEDTDRQTMTRVILSCPQNLTAQLTALRLLYQTN